MLKYDVKTSEEHVVDANSSGAVNYLNLAREILQKHGLTSINESDKQIPIANEN